MARPPGTLGTGCGMSPEETCVASEVPRGQEGSWRAGLGLGAGGAHIRCLVSAFVT